MLAPLYHSVRLLTLGRDNQAIGLIEEALALGMPPVLLSPIRWLETVNPAFFKKHGQILLAKALQDNNSSSDLYPKTLPVIQVKNGCKEADDQEPAAQAQVPQTQLPLDKPLRVSPVPPPSEDTIQFVKPVETSPGKPLFEPTEIQSKQTGLEEVTQPFKIVPYKSGPVEPITTSHKIISVEQPLKPYENSPVIQPVKPPEVKPIEQPVKVTAENERDNPAADAIRTLKAGNNPDNLRINSQKSSTQELEGKIPEFIPTSPVPTTRPDDVGVMPQKQAGYAATTNNQPKLKEIRSTEIENNNNPVSSTKKNGKLLLLSTIGAGLFIVIAVLLIFILFLNQNEIKLANNNQVVVSNTSTSSSTVASLPPTAPSLPGTVPASPTPVSTIDSSPPASGTISQTTSTTVLPVTATPVINNTATSGSTVSSTTQSATTAVPTPVPSTPTAPPVTSTPTPTQAPLSPLNLQPLNGHTGMLTTASWTKDGRYFLTASEDKTIKVWDATTNQLVRTLDDKARPNTAAILAARWSDDNQFIISGSADKYVRLYMVLPNQNISKSVVGSVLIEATDKVVPQAVVMAPDNSLLLYPGPNVVHSWNMNKDDQGPDFLLNSPDADVTALVFTADSKYLAVGLSTGIVQFWDVKANKLVLSISAGQAASPVTYLEWLPGEKQLVVGYREALSAYTVNLSGGAASITSTVTLPVNIKINMVAVSPDGKRLAVGSQTGQVELWSYDTKKLISEFSINGTQSAPVVGLHWNQTGVEISVVGGGTRPFLASYRIGTNK